MLDRNQRWGLWTLIYLAFVFLAFAVGYLMAGTQTVYHSRTVYHSQFCHVPTDTPPPDVIKQRESGGNPRAVNIFDGKPIAFGAWQFTQGFWDEVAQCLGRYDLVHVHASDVDPATQDEFAAYAWWDGKGACHWGVVLQGTDCTGRPRDG